MALEAGGFLQGFRAILDLGDTQRICCHLVVKQHGQDDASQILAGVRFPSLLVAHRETTACTTALAIICATQNHLASRPDVDLAPALRQVLELDGPCYHNVLVSTTRIPNFKEGTYRDWQNGFRQIGRLQSFSSTLPSPEFDDKLDVLAATADSGNSMASDFYTIWRPMGVSPESHFILIFNIRHPEPLPSIELPIDCRMFGLALPSSNTAPPSFDTPNLLSSTPSASGSPLYSPGSPAHHSSGSSAPSRGSRSRSTSPAPYRAASLGPSMTEVKDLCRLQVSDFETLEAKATWSAGTRGTNLATLARSFYAMEQVLDGLGLNPTDFKAPREFKLHSGEDLVLTAEDVLTSFGWKESTFSNKRTMYKRAESVAKSIWASSDTSDPNSPRMYEIHQGICYLWGGPLTHFDSALPSSKAPGAEGYTAGLRQGDLKHCDELLKIYATT
ncbi:hypothetical protein FB45DRAFT_872949 [Roridomyces roridus]|uniref:Uncharacterized protein n=1 Tax=Roridomyces roridus TaxID=1738132 RepID=A0AAD7BC27_9AGAR|nr:hypothetical protein FB45DRAFT_872949 [Roridomyces roridus]